MTSAVEFSTRTESILSQIMVGSLNYANFGKSTKQGGLKGCEHCGQLAHIGRARFLSLAIWAGLSQPSDRAELKGYIMRDIIHQADWFCVQKYLADLSFRRKVDLLIYSSIDDFKLNRAHSSALVASNMAITKRAYNKTWAGRYVVIHAQLRDWLMEAAQTIHQNGKNHNI